ncbi:tRNA(Met) cytidine acetyltransferase TmcA [Natronorubrum texcoconense]|uniref:tRNA(Met) cytidine acetyltransferase TmcA n=1 Tax=Natronorubrum texcoconense TaxID=1095776 RepID=A0A1G8V1X4_9EURY|nr:tRNA(Met) cytidine acetyltransferase TmcA [Natronorubrum texcoconense]SDJ59854.1 tRNA(Met) cytidine acetyltransferase [Natronorubrum texcoconense]
MDVDVVELAESLFDEATGTNERRLLVLAGDREEGYGNLESILDSLPVAITATTLVGPDDRLRCEHLPQANASDLLGTTRDVIALDVHDGLRPNALGKVVGAVDGGGLLVLLTPRLEDWPDRRGGEFDESLAVPPFSLADVTGRFRRRLVETLRAHRGIGIVDLEAEQIVDDGLTNPAPRCSRKQEPSLEAPTNARFPGETYEACLTGDQVDAVAAFESLLTGTEATEATGTPEATESNQPRAVVLEADRGRGKSSAAGLAAGAMAATGLDVLVTAPRSRNAAEIFDRARELCGTLTDVDAAVDTARRLETAVGGRVRFFEPTDAVARLETADVVIVDEAAALPVAMLESLLEADNVAFATTIHGYEGAGRGFSVRFRDRLAESDHEVAERTLVEPIRYAAGDPVEVWAFRALLLDARPPVESVVADATADSVEYRSLEPDDLLADEHLLREAFGLLVLAHYRTEPNDLARLLDAPNLEARALVHHGAGDTDDSDGGRVVSVALLAREGNLSPETRAMMYDGGRVRGNMLPDVLTSQLRDESAGEPAGLRVVRIATHHAVRSRGLGSRLLECIREEFSSETPGVSDVERDRRSRETVDWLGTGFGATPDLLEFWRENGYRTVHVSTTRNDASGEYSALMLAPTTESGADLYDRHADWFARRFPALCTDALSDLDPDVARRLLRSVDDAPAPPLELSEHDWRVVAGAAYGPGLFDVDPAPFRRLVVRYFVENPPDIDLTDREERLLVLRALQGRDVSTVAERLAYHSTGQCMRALGTALRPLVDRYGGDAALKERARFADK